MKRFNMICILGFLLLLTQSSFSQNKPNPGNTGPALSGSAPVQSQLSYPPGIKINYTKVYTPILPVTSESTFESTLKNEATKCGLTTNATDGLGRTLQTVMRRTSNTKKDIVQMRTYDPFGREVLHPLPYAKAETDPLRAGLFDPGSSVGLKNTYADLGYPGEIYLYGRTSYEMSLLSRPISSASQGNNWIGKNKEVTYFNGLNTSPVPHWTIPFSGGLPTYAGTFDVKKIVVNSITDEENNISGTYTDMLGRLIMKVDKGARTLFVYDDLGRLRYQIPNKAIMDIEANSNVLTQDIADNLCTRYEYDEDGRLIELKKPGIGETYYVYDKYDNIIFTQDPLKRSQNKWVFNKYDCLNRLIQTGLMNSQYGASPADGGSGNTTMSSPSSLYYTRQALQTLVSSTSLSDPLFHYIYQERTYKHSDYKYSFTNAKVYVTYFFDSYDFYGSIAITNTAFTGGFDNQQTAKLKGLLTAVSSELSDNSGSVWTLNLYNSRSEIIETRNKIPDGSIIVTTFGYDFTGNMIYSTRTHAGNTVTKKYQYDVWGRPTFVHHKINTASSFTKIATYVYDDIGRLKTKILGNMNYPINYEYNIRNWITGINKQYCANKNLDLYFGMELFYDKGYDQTYLDGKIAGIQWRNRGTVDELRSYGFSYDNGKLTQGDYVQKNENMGPDWEKTRKDFTTDVQYDGNGNITYMKHMGLDIGQNIIVLDELNYSYEFGSNRVKKIDDSGSSVDPSVHNGLGDFRDNINTPAATEDYTYDQNGNVTHDENRGVSTITNSWFTINKPTYIENADGDKIYYLYDGLGVLYQKKIVQVRNGVTHVTVFKYAGDIIYKNNELQLVMHDEGRVRVERQPDLSLRYSYDYFLKDHINNVRSIITEDAVKAQDESFDGLDPNLGMMQGAENGGVISEPDVDPITYIATSEVQNGAYEDELFENVDDTRDLRPLSDDLANRSCANVVGDANAQGVGPSILIKVSANDAVQLGVESFYFSNNLPSGQLSLGNLVTGIIGMLTGGAPLTSEGLALSSQGVPINAAEIGTALTQIRQGGVDTTRPIAFLNYLFFDNHMHMLPEASGAIQVASPDDWNSIDVPRFRAPQNGYLYVFTTNQSNMPTMFDNLYVVTWKGRLLEENHYYPYGLSFDTYKAPGVSRNDVKYNSQYIEQKEFTDNNGDDYGMDWYDFAARSYDPQIGRWMQPDPMMQHASPYLAMGDNPISFTDPMGLEDGIHVGGLQYTTSDGNGGVVTHWYDGPGWEEGHTDVFSYANAHGQSGGGQPFTPNEQRNWYKGNDPYNGTFWGTQLDTRKFYVNKGGAQGNGGTPWMNFAQGQLGQAEIPGGTNNPAIIGYHATTGGFKNDETAWCSSFVNWSMTQAGIKGTNSALAYSWKTWGQGLDKPAYGAIAVMNYSHVGFVAGINKDGRLILLGGNQGMPVGSVNLSPNMMNAVISYRYPAGFTPNYNLPSYNLNGRSLNLSLTR